MSFKSAILSNMHIKIAALVVGVVIWMFAKGEQEGDRLFAIPLVMRNVPEGLTIAQNPPDHIEVMLAGDNKELVRLNLWGEPYAVVDLTGAESGRTFRVSLSAANVVLPRDAQVQVVEVRDPRNLDLEIDRLRNRKLPVTPVVNGEPAEGFYVLGERSAMPESVSVFGPARVVSGLESVRTAELDISGRRNPVEAARAIDFEGPWNLHAVPKEVRVSVSIEGTRVATIPDVPTVFEHEPGFASATVDPEVLEITLSGPEHLVLSLTADDVLARVDAMGLPRGTHELVPEIHVPENIDIHGVVPPRVTVTLQ